MPPKRNKATHSVADRDVQTVYFSRRYLPTEVLNEILSHLSVKHLATLVSTSKETATMVENWLCSSSESILKIITELNKSLSKRDKFLSSFEKRFLQRSMCPAIANFMCQMTVHLPIKERLRWCFQYVPKVRKVWKTRCINPSDSVVIVSAALTRCIRGATDDEVDLAVKAVLKHLGVWRIILSECRVRYRFYCLAAEPSKEARMNTMVNQICSEQRALISAVKLISKELPMAGVSHFVFAVFNPRHTSGTEWLYVQYNDWYEMKFYSMNRFAAFLNEVWRQGCLDVVALIVGFIQSPEMWSAGQIASLLSELDEELCLRLSFALWDHEDVYKNMEMAQFVVQIGKYKNSLGLAILEKMYNEKTCFDFHKVLYVLFNYTSVLINQWGSSNKGAFAASTLSEDKLKNVVSFGNAVSELYSEFYEERVENGIPDFTELARIAVESSRQDR